MRAFANLFGMRDCLFVCWRVVVVVAVWLLLCVCVEFLWFAVCVGCRSSSSRVARLACLLKFLLGRWRWVHGVCTLAEVVLVFGKKHSASSTLAFSFLALAPACATSLERDN